MIMVSMNLISKIEMAYSSQVTEIIRSKSRISLRNIIICRFVVIIEAIYLCFVVVLIANVDA